MHPLRGVSGRESLTRHSVDVRAAELGWYPANLDDESLARHRADAARKKTDHDPANKWAHLTEPVRQREVEAAGRAAVADLYE